MQNERGRDMRDPFDMFGGFGNFGGSSGSIFGRDPFDDPFFTRPFGSMFDQSNLVGEHVPVVPPAGPIIQELNSDDDDDDDDDEEEEEHRVEDGIHNAKPSYEPFIDHPDDETDGTTKRDDVRTDYNRAGGTQPQTVRVHSSKVTYGGIDGVYYSSSSTRKMGSDGAIVEECKEADKSKGEAKHRISRGLHDKGHSVTRKLNSDGKVDTLQTLHNLNEDELGSFEEAWRTNGVTNNGPSWAGPFGSGGSRMSDSLLLPFAGHTRIAPSSELNNGRNDPSGGRAKKVVRIPIE